MSLILKLFGFTGLPQWLIELLVVFGLGLGIWIYHLHVVDSSIKKGIQEQQAADDTARSTLNAQTDQQTAQKLAVAEKAADDAHTELDAIKQNVATHAQRGSLCQRTTTYHRSPVVPEGGAAHSGNVSTGPSSSVVQPVQPGDPGSSGYSQRELFTALSAVADATSAPLREFQKRFPTDE